LAGRAHRRTRPKESHGCLDFASDESTCRQDSALVIDSGAPARANARRSVQFARRSSIALRSRPPSRRCQFGAESANFGCWRIGSSIA
jgi:hypothetical protein